MHVRSCPPNVSEAWLSGLIIADRRTRTYAHLHSVQKRWQVRVRRFVYPTVDDVLGEGQCNHVSDRARCILHMAAVLQ